MGAFVKKYRLVFLIFGLIFMLIPGTALAQEKTDLSLRLIPGDYNKEVIPGKETILHLEIHNSGDTPVTNIRLSAETPEDWDIEFDPAVINRLSAGSIQTVDISVIPARNASKDRNRLNIIAHANETRRITTIYLRINEAASIWTWVGIGVAVLVIAFLSRKSSQSTRCMFTFT